MPMALVVTRNAEGRFRGYLSSVLLEVAPGVYVSPNMTAGIRDRTWKVLSEWHEGIDGDRAIVMVYPDSSQPSGMKVLVLGTPAKDMLDLDGIWLVRSDRRMPPEKD